MKKEILAALTIIGLLAGSVVNILHLESLIDEISVHLYESSLACETSNLSLAENEVRNALDLWLNADDYTHIFIQHSEIDAASDIFYDILSAINDEDSASAMASIEQLYYHLNSIYTTELVTFRSVF